MKTTLAKVTGLALIAASFAFCGSLAYADTEDTTSIQVLTFDAVGNPGEIIAALDCDTEDGVGGSPVKTSRSLRRGQPPRRPLPTLSTRRYSKPRPSPPPTPPNRRSARSRRSSPRSTRSR